MKKKVWKSSCRSNLMWVTVSSDSSTFARSSFYYGPSTSRAESIDEDGCLVHRGNKLAYSSSSFIRPAALLENPFGLPPGPLYFVSFFFSCSLFLILLHKCKAYTAFSCPSLSLVKASGSDHQETASIDCACIGSDRLIIKALNYQSAVKAWKIWKWRQSDQKIKRQTHFSA